MFIAEPVKFRRLFSSADKIQDIVIQAPEITKSYIYVLYPSAARGLKEYIIDMLDAYQFHGHACHTM